MKIRDQLKGNQCNIFQLIKYKIMAWYLSLEDKLYPLKPLTEWKRCKKCGKYIFTNFASYPCDEIENHIAEICRCSKKREKSYRKMTDWLDFKDENKSWSREY